jgi:hypothetical protein
VKFAFHKTGKCQCMPNSAVAWRTNWVKATVVMHYGSPNVTPNETRPTVTKCSTCQRNLCAHSVVCEHRSSPCSDQSTTSDKNKIFHAIYAQVVILCPCEPADHIVSDVLLKYSLLDSIFAEAPMRKRQKRSRTPARISDTIGSARLQLMRQPRMTTTHCSGDAA